MLRVLASADENAAWFSTSSSPPLGFEREVLEGFARLHQLKLEVVPTPSRRLQIDFTEQVRRVIPGLRPG